MATIYTVKSAVVKVTIGAAKGNRVAHIAHRGDVLPEGISEDQLGRLERRGMVVKTETGKQASTTSGRGRNRGATKPKPDDTGSGDNGAGDTPPAAGDTPPAGGDETPTGGDSEQSSTAGK